MEYKCTYRGQTTTITAPTLLAAMKQAAKHFDLSLSESDQIDIVAPSQPFQLF